MSYFSWSEHSLTSHELREDDCYLFVLDETEMIFYYPSFLMSSDVLKLSDDNVFTDGAVSVLEFMECTFFTVSSVKGSIGTES